MRPGPQCSKLPSPLSQGIRVISRGFAPAAMNGSKSPRRILLAIWLWIMFRTAETSSSKSGPLASIHIDEGDDWFNSNFRLLMPEPATALPRLRIPIPNAVFHAGVQAQPRGKQKDRPKGGLSILKLSRRRTLTQRPRAILSSSMPFPLARCLVTQPGVRPLPAHVCEGSAGFRNFA